MKVAAEISGVGSRFRRLATNRIKELAEIQQRERVWQSRIEAVVKPPAIARDNDLANAPRA
ncbi:MAG: hypothetical protein H6875_07470 [Hyphomicrobiaceae bacterium]|nr:hypothetical protein [Hyphomicrobiaceae bacterium]